MESNTESAKMSLLKELFISLDDRTVIVRRFPINPNTPTRGCYENILINSFIDVLSVFTIQTPSKWRLHVSAVSKITFLLMLNWSQYEVLLNIRINIFNNLISVGVA